MPILEYAKSIAFGFLILSAPLAHSAQVTSLSVGDGFVCSLFDDGSIKCWGSGQNGELGQGDTNNRGDQPNTMGAQLLPIAFGTTTPAVQISTGDHACAVFSDHTVKCWGLNSSGELGTGDTANRGDQAGAMATLQPIPLGTGRTALQVAAGGNFTCALLDDHSVKCWGANESGQLGQGSTASIGGAANQMGDALPPISLGNGRTALAIGVGISFACALLDDHQLKCWGLNASGQLGLGDAVNRGDQPGSMGDALPEIDLGPGRTVTDFTVSQASVCALLDDSELKCWGANESGELGVGDSNSRGSAAGQMGANLPAVTVEPDLTPSAISCGYESCCVTYTLPGTVKCWGANESGELGLEDQVNRGAGTTDMGLALPFVNLGSLVRVSQVFVGGASDAGGVACALLDDKTVRCWGYNQDGELGLGDTNNRGDRPGTMGSALPAIPLQ